MSTLLVHSADWLVTVDADRRIIRDGALAVEDDRIVAVGKTADVPRSFVADRSSSTWAGPARESSCS